MKKIFILTGEPSGDKLASTVISKIMKENKNIEYPYDFFVVLKLQLMPIYHQMVRLLK